MLASGAVAAWLLVAQALEPGSLASSPPLLAGSASYAYALPGAELVAGVALVASRARAPAAAAGGLGIPGTLVLFAWLSLVILNLFPAKEGRLERARIRQRDLAMSIAWPLYAIALLGAGSAVAACSLRWASLALLLVSLAKDFLHDLGELEGLYRVGSVAGLAVSLLLVSLVSQRFVFRSPRAA